MLMYKSKLTMGEEGGWIGFVFRWGGLQQEQKLLYGTNLQMRDGRDGGNSDERLFCNEVREEERGRKKEEERERRGKKKERRKRE
jgi:hypothetical protein